MSADAPLLLMNPLPPLHVDYTLQPAHSGLACTGLTSPTLVLVGWLKLSENFVSAFKCLSALVLTHVQ